MMTNTLRKWSLPRVLKWVMITLVCLAVLLIAAVLVYRSASLPTTSGQLRVNGLNAPVRVVRDAAAVAHISASNDHDAMFALGYVHAQDRLWQMHFNRRVAAGRLSELVGEPGVSTDKFLRTIGIARAAQRIEKSLPTATLQVFQDYADGVNAFLNTSGQALPPEFILMRADKPEPWTVQDSIGWSLMMAWDLSGNWGSELMRLRLAKRGLSLAQINQFLPPYPGENPPNTADYTQTLKTIIAQSESIKVDIAAMVRDEGAGSNNWVVSGAHTTSGKPLLANDPHLGLQAPALWYFAHLNAPNLNVIGATLPGVPGVVLGRNDHIAWGFTNTGPDTQDLFFERFNPSNPNQVQTPTGWQDLKVIREVIKVRGAPDVALTVRESRHGPLISEGASASATESAPKGYGISFSWAALNQKNTTANATLAMNKAKNWVQFVQAARDWTSPQQNMVYADVEGNVGFIAPGLIPVRQPENDLKGLFPAPGWDARYDWDGVIPFDQLPQEFNPASGMRWTANERIVPPDYPHHLTYEWASPYRADRIAQLLKAQPKHSVQTFSQMQADSTSLAAQELLPVLKALRASADVSKRTAAERAALDAIENWNGNMATDQAAPLIYMTWVRELTRLVYADELGPLFNDYWDQRQLFLANTMLGRKDAGQWCNQVTANDPKVTEQIKSCSQIADQAFTQAVKQLSTQCGESMNRCRWGQVHYAHSEHRPFTKVAALARWFDVVNEVPGDTYTVNVNRHHIRNEQEPFVSKHAASLRAIYDLADMNNSVFMHSTGQSGNVFSAHYRDYAQKWSQVQYVPMLTDPTRYEVNAIGVLELQPEIVNSMK